jgi:hypothetical protein
MFPLAHRLSPMLLPCSALHAGNAEFSDESQEEDITNHPAYPRAMARAMRLINYRERSAHELCKRLQEDQYPPELVEAVLSKVQHMVSGPCSVASTLSAAEDAVVDAHTVAVYATRTLCWAQPVALQCVHCNAQCETQPLLQLMTPDVAHCCRGCRMMPALQRCLRGEGGGPSRCHPIVSNMWVRLGQQEP